MHSAAYHNIINTLRSFCPVSDDEMNEMATYFKVVHLKRNDYLLKEGKVCSEIGS